jgi:hypothetical protein
MWRPRPIALPLPRRPIAAIAERLFVPILLGVVVAAMAAWTWSVWANPLSDFGRDVYVAWRVAEGDALYRDVAYFNGPFSPWINAAILKAAGPSLKTLYLANGVVLALTAGSLWILFRAIAGRGCGAVGALLFLLLFAFAQYTEQGAPGGYNFVAPYSHEITHGIFLSLAGLILLKTWLERGTRAWLLAAGMVLGLVFLTKPEIFAAAACSYGAAILLKPQNAPRPWARRLVDGAVVASGAAVVWAAAVVLLAAALPWRDAVWHSLGAWPHVANPGLADMDFYRWVGGFDAPQFRLATIAFWFLAQTLVLRLAWRWALRRPLREGWMLEALLLAAASILGLRWPAAVSYANVFAPLPVWLAILLAIGFKRLLSTEEENKRLRLVLGLATAAFALGLLAKIILNARIYHYGFGLAMPAVLAVVAGGFALANEVRRRGGSAARFAIPPAAFLAIVGGIYLAKMDGVLRRHGEGRILAADGQRLRVSPDHAERINAALRDIEQHVGPEQTLAVWPQGAMINVLARRRNPTRYMILLPPEVEMFGEAEILAACRRSPPDFILLTGCDMRGYGRGEFLHGYARSLGSWLDVNYAPIPCDAAPSCGKGLTLLARVQIATASPRAGTATSAKPETRKPSASAAAPAGSPCTRRTLRAVSDSGRRCSKSPS